MFLYEHKYYECLSFRYATSLQSQKNISSDPGRVIAFSVYSRNPNITIGAVRNVQLARMIFPQWNTRIYTPHPNASREHDRVPQQVLNKMANLGAQIYYSDTTNSAYPLKYLSLNVIEDKSVNTFLIRNPEHRLSDKQCKVVDDWLKSNANFHCMRDHFTHSLMNIVPELYGVKLSSLTKENKRSGMLKKLLAASAAKNVEHKLWEMFNGSALCHDSVSCDAWPNSKPFPALDFNDIYSIDQKYDSYMVPVNPVLKSQKRKGC